MGFLESTYIFSNARLLNTVLGLEDVSILKDLGNRNSFKETL